MSSTAGPQVRPYETSMLHAMHYQHLTAADLVLMMGSAMV